MKQAISTTSKPKVSVIILNWNGKRHLEKCLKSWEKVTYKQKEIIVVNNGSTDDSAEFLKKNYPEVRVIELKKNRGFAGANNIGVRESLGEYVLLLNNDTEVTPNFLESLVTKMGKRPDVGAIQPQLRSMIKRQLLDSVGSYLTTTGYYYHFGYMKPYDNPKYTKELEVYSIKGACFIMRKKDYQELGGFDEDFICYVEETDLCHRIWLSGKRVLYDPSIHIYHLGGGDMHVMTDDKVTVFRSFRNKYLLAFKNLSAIACIQILPVHFLMGEMFVFASLLRGRFKYALGAQVGIFAPLLMLPKILKKRTYIQKKIRKIDDASLLPKIIKNPRLSYYYYTITGVENYRD